ncbi:putative nucleoprotein [Steelhead trout orthomyxovirus-1]|uniref:Nucleoprotein n=1 Tax=Steelhead trout orthomyxovirus-1 TaxID=1954186 RepID=A0A1Q1MMD9_9ORTO|nr:putative nucleoprotein [Steelhead trout orthomyxovirus-1]
MDKADLVRSSKMIKADKSLRSSQEGKALLKLLSAEAKKRKSLQEEEEEEVQEEGMFMDMGEGAPLDMMGRMGAIGGIPPRKETPVGTAQKRQLTGNESAFMKKRAKRASNFNKFLDMVSLFILTKMEELSLSKREQLITENSEAMVRVLALAENEGERKIYRDNKSSTIADTVTINLAKDDGFVHVFKISLDKWKKEFREMWAGSGIVTEEGTKQTIRGTVYNGMALLMKSIGAKDQFFAPGKRRVVENGFSLHVITQTEGMGVPSRFAAMNRRAMGVYHDVSSLLNAIKSGASKNGKKIYEVIKSNMKGRFKSAWQVRALESMGEAQSTETNRRIADALLNSCGAIPARKVTAYLPPFATFIARKERNLDITGDFMTSPESAMAYVTNTAFYEAMAEDDTPQLKNTLNVVAMLGSPFVSVSIIRKTCAQTLDSRRGTESKTCRLRKGPENIPEGAESVRTSAAVRIQKSKFNIAGYEKRDDADGANGGSGGWQITSSNTYGSKAAFDQAAVMAAVLGTSGKQGQAANISKVMKGLATAVRGAESTTHTKWINALRGEEMIRFDNQGLYSAALMEVDRAEALGVPSEMGMDGTDEYDMDEDF